MRRIAALLAGLALVGGPACALAPFALEMEPPVGQAGPPAPEVTVLILPSGGGKSGELLGRAAPGDGSGLLRLAEPRFSAADFEDCLAAGVESEACIRTRLAERDAMTVDGPPTVIVLLRPGPGFYIGWTCIGVGEGPTAADRQTVTLDWQPHEIDASASEAAGCILAAAAESGW